jgi:hypothetical protein
VRVDLSLGGELNFGSLGSNLSQILGNNTGVGSGPIFGVPLTVETALGVTDGPAVVGLQNVAAGAAASGQSVLNGLDATLDGLSAGAGGSTSPSGDALGSGVIGVLPQSVGGLIGQAHSVLGSDTAVMNVVSDVADLSSLQKNGDVSSGDHITFPDPPTIAAQVDHLFTAGQYTDFGLTMHSDDNSGNGKIVSTLTSHTVDGSGGSSSLVDAPIQQHDSGSLQPGKIVSTLTSHTVDGSAGSSSLVDTPIQQHDAGAPHLEQHYIGASSVPLPVLHDEFTVNAASI